MRLRTILTGGAAAGAFALMLTAAQAAPLGAGGTDLKSGATAAPVEKAAYRRCWFRNGVRYCRWFDDDYGYYDYDTPYYGYGPGFGFYFGGGHGGHFHGGHFHGGGHHR